jgi:hypothetical protein
VTGADAAPRRALRASARLPALLLVGVALCQVWLSQRAQLTPWSGGGFGMFSSTDVWARRHLHVHALAPGLRRELEVPEALREELRRALALPTEARLRSFALRLAAATDPRELAGAEALSLGVYATRFDPRTLAPSGTPLRALRVPLRDAVP